MNIPFTKEDFFNVFIDYNIFVFPFQIILLLIGLTLLFLINSKYKGVNILIITYLSFLFAWIGVIYFFNFFSSINPGAKIFGSLFIIQSALLIFNIFKRNVLEFTYEKNNKHIIGVSFVILGLIVYPIIGILIEGSFSKIISVGLPCPTIIIFYGFILLTKKTLPKYLLIIPTIWAIIGTTAVFNFSVYQDILLIVVAVITIVLSRNKK